MSGWSIVILTIEIILAAAILYTRCPVVAVISAEYGTYEPKMPILIRYDSIMGGENKWFFTH